MSLIRILPHLTTTIIRLEVVGRGSETQFQVIENLNCITYRFQGFPVK